MFQNTRRYLIAGVGALAIGVFAVACSGAPQASTTPFGNQAHLMGFSVQLPPLTSPFAKSAPAPAALPTQSQTQTQVTGAVHGGTAGCPISLSGD